MRKEIALNYLRKHFDSFNEHDQDRILKTINKHRKETAAEQRRIKKRLAFEAMTWPELQEALKKAVEKTRPRGTWRKAVKEDALMLIEQLEEAFAYEERPYTAAQLEKILLNGACDWWQYSEGGCALIYDGDIVEHYCNNTEKKIFDYGNKEPSNSFEENWLQVQGRALYQAARVIEDAFYTLF